MSSKDESYPAAFYVVSASLTVCFCSFFVSVFRYISGGQWKLHAGDDTQVLPAWVKYWAKGFADKFRSLHGDDFFILSRNAWAGTWSDGAALWSGDIGSNFGELQTAVAAGQGAAMSGVALWTTDIGGCKWSRSVVHT